jgi:hypothetical protein
MHGLSLTRFFFGERILFVLGWLAPDVVVGLLGEIVGLQDT